MASRCPFSISLTHTHKISNLATISIFQLLVAAFTALSYSSKLCFEPQVSLHFCNFYIYLNFVLLFFLRLLGTTKAWPRAHSRRVALRCVCQRERQKPKSHSVPTAKPKPKSRTKNVAAIEPRTHTHSHSESISKSSAKENGWKKYVERGKVKWASKRTGQNSFQPDRRCTVGCVLCCAVLRPTRHPPHPKGHHTPSQLPSPRNPLSHWTTRPKHSLLWQRLLRLKPKTIKSSKWSLPI